MLIFPSWRERAHWAVLNVNCMNFCTFSFSSCLLRRRRICPNIAKACCYAELTYKQHLIKISLSNLMFSRIMWFSFILYWVRWSHFITTNIFNNTLKCEFLGLTSSVSPIDEAHARRFFGYIFVLSPVSLVSAAATTAQVKKIWFAPHFVCIQTIKSLFWSYLLWWLLGMLHCWRWGGILLDVLIYLCVLVTLALSCMGSIIAEQGADVAILSPPACLFFHHPLKEPK